MRKSIWQIIWPFVHRDTHDQLRTENFVLRDALREANAELYKHRQLIHGLNTGQSEITEWFEFWSKKTKEKFNR